MSTILIYSVSIVILLAFSAFFSGSEIAYSALNRTRLEAGHGSDVKLTLNVHEHFDQALSAILIGNNLVNISSSSIATLLALLLAGAHATAAQQDLFTSAASILLTALVLIFGETMPKIVARRDPQTFAVRAARPLWFLMTVLKPVIWVINGAVKLITAPLKGESLDEDEEAEAAEVELLDLIETSEDEGIIDEEQSELLQNALDFAEISAQEVMTPRVDMVALEIDDDPAQLRRQIEESPFSRLPVYDERRERVIGVLYLNRYYRALLDYAGAHGQGAGDGSLPREQSVGDGSLSREQSAGNGSLFREQPAGDGSLLREQPAGNVSPSREQSAGDGSLPREQSAGNGSLSREQPAGDGSLEQPLDLRSLLIDPCFVYKTTKLPAILTMMRQRKTHIAIVTDEYGSTIGMVTMEDVLEQIVGDIWDETDEVVDEVVERGEHEYEIDGDLSIGELCELMEWDEDEFETDSLTVGGWTLEKFGGFPKAGDSFDHENVTVTVLEMDDLRVGKLLLTVHPAQEDEPKTAAFPIRGRGIEKTEHNT